MQIQQVDILAFGAHPDDVECAVAGTILKHVALRKKIAIVDLTAGEMGSYGNPETRKAESAKAGKLMGITCREQLGLRDGAIMNNEANRLSVISIIRKYRPAIVLANALSDYHPDHGIAAKLVADAAFLSGLKKINTTLNGKPQLKWRPRVVYHYIQDKFAEPDFVIDITRFMEKKLKAISAYNSQFGHTADQQYNSVTGLLNQIKRMNGIYGRPVNVQYAEGFTVNRYIGTEHFFQLI